MHHLSMLVLDVVLVAFYSFMLNHEVYGKKNRATNGFFLGIFLMYFCEHFMALAKLTTAQ